MKSHAIQLARIGWVRNALDSLWADESESQSIEYPCMGSDTGFGAGIDLPLAVFDLWVKYTR